MPEPNDLQISAESGAVVIRPAGRYAQNLLRSLAEGLTGDADRTSEFVRLGEMDAATRGQRDRALGNVEDDDPDADTLTAAEHEDRTSEADELALSLAVDLGMASLRVSPDRARTLAARLIVLAENAAKTQAYNRSLADRLAEARAS